MAKEQATYRLTFAGVVPIAAVLVVQFACYLVPKAILPEDAYFIPALAAWDAWVPFVPAFVVFYVGAFVQWTVYYVQFACADTPLKFRFMGAEILAKFIAATCFLVLPLTMVRPEVAPELTDGLFSWGVGVIYAVDTPTCLCPSLHCLQSYYCTRRYFALGGGKGRGAGCGACRSVPRWLKVASAVFTCAVFASTVLIKQHYLIDIVAGVALAELSLHLVRVTRFDTAFRRFCTWLTPGKAPRR